MFYNIFKDIGSDSPIKKWCFNRLQFNQIIFAIILYHDLYVNTKGKFYIKISVVLPHLRFRRLPSVSQFVCNEYTSKHFLFIPSDIKITSDIVHSETRPNSSVARIVECYRKTLVKHLLTPAEWSNNLTEYFFYPTRLDFRRVRNTLSFRTRADT